MHVKNIQNVYELLDIFVRQAQKHKTVTRFFYKDTSAAYNFDKNGNMRGHIK